MQAVAHDVLPPDPFAEDPDDPARALSDHEDTPEEPISAEERTELLDEVHRNSRLHVFDATVTPPKQVASFLSEVLVLGVPDGEGGTILLGTESEDAPLGAMVY